VQLPDQREDVTQPVRLAVEQVTRDGHDVRPQALVISTMRRTKRASTIGPTCTSLSCTMVRPARRRGSRGSGIVTSLTSGSSKADAAPYARMPPDAATTPPVSSRRMARRRPGSAGAARLAARRSGQVPSSARSTRSSRTNA